MLLRSVISNTFQENIYKYDNKDWSVSHHINIAICKRLRTCGLLLWYILVIVASFVKNILQRLEIRKRLSPVNATVKTVDTKCRIAGKGQLKHFF